MQKFNRLLWSLLVIWLLTVITLSSFRVFDAGSLHFSRAPLPLGLAVTLPILIFAAWFLGSPAFRKFLLGLNPVVLTAVHAWRIGGIVFLILSARGLLPAAFALPAGLGDIAIGVTAPFVARSRAKHRRPTALYIFWQYAGIADLVIAVGTGVLSSPTSIGVLAHGVSTRLMGLLPMSLIPTFVVPLLIILHLICLAQVRRKAGAPQEAKGEPVFQN